MTGETPNACPWRAFYDPLVAEVIALRWAMDPPNLDAVLEPDPPGILLEAIKVFSLAVNATLAEDRKIQKARDEAKRAADGRRNR